MTTHADRQATSFLSGPKSSGAIRCGFALGAALLLAAPALAWELNLTSAPRRVFLTVGNGAYDQNSSVVNRVEVDVPVNALGNGNPLIMHSDSTQSSSPIDGYLTCPNPSAEVLIGASYRRRNGRDGPARATLRVSAPANLVNAAGETIPISEISWTVSASGSSSPNIIPAGQFAPGTQTLTTVRANTYIENCHTFTFANSAVRAAGIYSGQVTYTLSSP